MIWVILSLVYVACAIAITWGIVAALQWLKEEYVIKELKEKDDAEG